MYVRISTETQIEWKWEGRRTYTSIPALVDQMFPVGLRRGRGGIVERIELEQQPRAGYSGGSQGLRA